MDHYISNLVLKHKFLISIKVPVLIRKFSERKRTMKQSRAIYLSLKTDFSKTHGNQEVQVKMDVIPSSTATYESTTSATISRHSAGLCDSHHSTKLCATPKVKQHCWAGHGGQKRCWRTERFVYSMLFDNSQDTVEGNKERKQKQTPWNSSLKSN